MDFQAQQIEKIVEAIALTMPSGAESSNNNSSFYLGGGTISSYNVDFMSN